MKQITTAVIKQMKQNGEPVTMVTAYDYAMAKNVCEAGIEMILVGDSLGNVVLGYNSTVPVTMDEMIHHTKAVMRAAQGSATMVVGDMPFMSYQASVVDGMYNAARFLKETGWLCGSEAGRRRGSVRIGAETYAGRHTGCGAYWAYAAIGKPAGRL